MLAIVKERPEPGVTIKDIPIPSIKNDEVLVEVKAAGICGSDTHIYEWSPNYEWTIPSMPYVVCHEFCGQIKEVGKNVAKFKPGDRVAVMPTFKCGQCHYCMTDRRKFCNGHDGVHGLTKNGGFAEYCATPVRGLVKLPDNVSWDVGAIIEPMGVTANAVNDANIRIGDFVVVFGPGPIGLLTMMFAQASGAGRVVMVGTSRDETRLKVARNMGADLTLKSDEVDVCKTILEMTNGFGADIAFEATGVPRLAQYCLDLVDKDGTVVLVGIYPTEGSINLTTTVRQAKKLIGTYGGEITWDRLLRWVSSNNKLAENAVKIISHRSKLSEAVEAFERSVHKENIKEIFTEFK